ncbi:MAG TPA: hypothetical protein VF458_03415 [Ktedonobacteraceae bacterium]
MIGQFKWKDATIFFDNEEFRVGFERGREIYFHYVLPERDEAGLPRLKASELLRLVAVPDQRGGFRLDREKQIEQTPGALVGYVSALSCPEAPVELQQWEKLPELAIQAEVEVMLLTEQHGV